MRRWPSFVNCFELKNEDLLNRALEKVRLNRRRGYCVVESIQKRLRIVSSHGLVQVVISLDALRVKPHQGSAKIIGFNKERISRRNVRPAKLMRQPFV